jgi:hypothetical protein
MSDMPYAIMRMTKHKGGSATAIEKHHEREKEAYQSNPDIELTRTALNYHIKAPEGKYVREVQRRIEAAKCRVRKDSVKMVDVFIGASPEFMSALPEPEQHAFLQHAYDFMKAKIGEENIFSAVVHMDEATPHMHLCFVPLTHDKRLSAKEILGNKAGLRAWQDEFYAHMSARWPILERGERAAETQRKHKTVQEYKKITNLSPEYMRLWDRYSRLKRRWERVPYPIQKAIVEREVMKKQERKRTR